MIEKKNLLDFYYALGKENHHGSKLCIAAWPHAKGVYYWVRTKNRKLDITINLFHGDKGKLVKAFIDNKIVDDSYDMEFAFWAEFGKKIRNSGISKPCFA